MSTRNKTAKLFALAMMVTGLAGCANNTVSEKETVPTDMGDMTVADEIGTGIAFGQHRLVAGETDSLNSVMGVQLLDGTEGKKSLRYIAAFTGYNGLQSAAFKRTVKNGDTVIKEEKTLDVNYVYTSVKDADNVKWSAPLDATYHYFMVYTLRNIPEDHWFDVASVTITANPINGEALTCAQTANVQGVIGDLSEGVKYEQTDTEKEAGTWHTLKNAPGEKAVVTANHIKIDETAPYVAVNLGKVVSIGNPTSSTGGFENCSSMKEVVLPDTIETFNKWCFAGCKVLEKLTFPKNLTSILASAFNNVDALQTIDYQATALTAINDSIDHNVGLVKVGKGVTALTDTSFVASSYLVEKVEYEGTTAEWTALIGEKTNGLNIDNVFCSDTETVDFNYHIGEGTIKIGGQDTTGDYERTYIKGHKAIDIGDPILAGKAFKGWFTAATEGTEFDFETALTNDTDIYAQYEELPAGKSIDDPLLLNAADYTGTATTMIGMEKYFIKYTAPATDTYYFGLNKVTINEAISNTTYTSYAEVKFYDSAKTAIASPSKFSMTNTAAIQQISSSDPWIYSLAMTKDEVYYISLDAYESSYNKDKYAYGTMDYAIWTDEGDTVDTAKEYTFGAKQEVTFDDRYSNKSYQNLMYTYTPTADKTVSFKGENIGSLYFSFEVYDVTDEAKPKVGKLSGTDTESTVLNLTANHKYIVLCTTNSVSTATKKVYFTIADPEPGTVASNPCAVGSDVSFNVPKLGSQYVYYKLEASAEAIYQITLNNGSTSYAKQITITDPNGTELVSKTEEGTTDSDYEGYETTSYGSTLSIVITLPKLETGKYYLIKVGYSSASAASSSSYSFSYTSKIVEKGEIFEAPSDYKFKNGSNTYYSTSAGRYYGFTPTADAPTNFHFAPSAEGQTISATLYDANKKVLATSDGSSDFHYDLVKDSEYVLLLKNSATDGVIVVQSDYVSPLAGKEFLGQYMGCKAGSNYYKMTINGDGYTWETGSNTNSLTLTSETNGITVLTGDKTTITTNNTDAWIVKDGYNYFMSKNCTTYTSGSISGKQLKTASASNTSGTIIISVVKTADSVRTYGVMIDGVIYLGVTFEFTTGNAIEEKDSAFSIKSGDTVLGNYTSSGTALTKVIDA